MDDINRLISIAIKQGRGNLTAVGELKDHVFRRLGEKDGFALCQSAGLFRETDKLELKRILGVFEAAREFGTSLIIIDGGGQPFTLEPPLVIGDGNHRPLNGVSRAVFLASFTNVHVKGRSGFVDAENAAFFDLEPWEVAQFDDWRAYDPFIFSDLGAKAWVLSRESGSVDLNVEEAFTLLGPHSPAFGHWLWEFLPKYLQARHCGLAADVPILIDEGLAESQRQSLELVAPEARLIEVPALNTARVGRLWCGPTLMPMPTFTKITERFRVDLITAPSERFLPVISSLRSCAHHIAPAEGALIYLARKERQHRKLANRGAIEDIASHHGFEIVYLEDLPFTDQVARLKGARHVIGPEGSALNLLCWAMPGTSLLILNHTITIGTTTLSTLLEIGGMDVTVLTGRIVQPHPRFPHFSDYEIDEKTFENVVADMLRATPRHLT